MKRKTERYEVIRERENVIEPSKECYQTMRGNWNAGYFKNSHPITLELACGRGEYTVGLARLFPNRNYIGVDVKGERIWKGSSIAVEENLTNVAFLRTEIFAIEVFFAPQEVDEIWITFPDPRSRKRDAKRRLTSPRFLELYKKVIKPGGLIRLKTDNKELFDFTVETLSARGDVSDLHVTYDVYSSPFRDECFDIKTRYESMFAAEGETIKYLRFRFS